MSGPTFVVNSAPVGCHAAADAEAPVVVWRDPGTIQAMDQMLRAGDGVWYREVERECWTRTETGPIACIVPTLAEAEACALALRPRSAPETSAPAPPPVVPAAPPRPAPVVPTPRGTTVAPPAAPALRSAPPSPVTAPRTATPPPVQPAPAATPVTAANWTVILHSYVIADGETRDDAEAEAARIRALGWDANVLLSDDWTSLRPGYWVVYSGSFRTASQAQAYTDRLRAAGFGEAYARLLAR